MGFVRDTTTIEVRTDVVEARHDNHVSSSRVVGKEINEVTSWLFKVCNVPVFKCKTSYTSRDFGKPKDTRRYGVVVGFKCACNIILRLLFPRHPAAMSGLSLGDYSVSSSVHN